MRKQLGRAVFILLGISVILSAHPVSAIPGNVGGEGQRNSENIIINGVDTGARHTQITLPSGTAYNPYSSESVINVIEAKPGSGLSFAALNCGKYTYSKETVGAAALAYNKTHNGTVVAAINADPWYIYHSDYDGDGKKATGESVKHHGITRNLLIIDGEIYQTPGTTYENFLNNNGTEYGTPSSPSYIFGQSRDGSYIIGKFTLDITLKNETTGKDGIIADGINRLPAPGAIMLYNSRVGEESLAYTDAYEVYVKCDDSTFRLGEAIRGTVVGIYECGEGERPAIDENTVVISARGRGDVPDSYTSVTDKTILLRGLFGIGDEITLSTSVGKDGDTYDYSQTERWYGVTNAIGGFYNQVTKGVVNADLNADGSEKNNAYPVPLIALKNDGTAMMITITSKSDTRAGTRQKYIGDICLELGAYTAIMFDGGGSSSVITYEDGAYLRRGGYADGTPRKVVNALALVFDGVSVDVQNKETGARADIDGIPNDKTAPTPNTPLGMPAIVGVPTVNYKYCTNVDFINGEGPYHAVSSYKNTVNGAYQAALFSDGVVLDEDRQLTVTGWSLINGGQGGHFWSVDSVNWYPCTGTQYNLDMGNWDAIKAAAVNMSAVNSIKEEKAKFTNAAADLTAFAGQTIDVYFGVGTFDNSNVALMLKIENVSVPEIPPHIHTPNTPSCTDATLCTGCGDVLSPALGHSYDGENDAECNTCGNIRELPEREDIPENTGDKSQKDDNALPFVIIAVGATLAVFAALALILFKNRKGSGGGLR